MKNALITVVFFLLTGCAITPQQGAALASAESGNVYATWALGKSGQSAIKALTDLQNELPQIPLGKVTAFNIGSLQAELQQAKIDFSKAGNNQAVSQITSFISLVADNQGTLSGGIVTADQALVFAAFQNVANGIGNGVQTWQGQQSVLNPTPAASAVTK